MRLTFTNRELTPGIFRRYLGTGVQKRLRFIPVSVRGVSNPSAVLWMIFDHKSRTGASQRASPGTNLITNQKTTQNITRYSIAPIHPPMKIYRTN